MTLRKIRATTILVATVYLSGACALSDTATAHDKPAFSAPGIELAVDSARAILNAALEPGALATVSTAPVMLWKGPGGESFEVRLRTSDPSTALARRFGNVTMQNSLRTTQSKVGQYPCTSCHMGRNTILADTRIADAHQDVKSVHPVQTGGVCSTCHSAANVELLALKSGERATLDHAYRLCAQCHFSQAEAWAAGAHGKRLDGWQGRRVVMGCADCHDPHKPALQPRIPFRAPQMTRIRDRNQ